MKRYLTAATGDGEKHCESCYGVPLAGDPMVQVEDGEHFPRFCASCIDAMKRLLRGPAERTSV